MDTGLSILLIVVVVLALLALANALFALIADRRHLPIGRFIECGGVRLHFIERGDAARPALVMLHGNGAMVQDLLLSGLVARAAQKYRVVCFDRPGFGHSTRPRRRLWTPQAQAELFAEAMTRLGIERALVLGHSWGAMVALALAMRAPAQVQGLVLAAGYYFPTARKDVFFLSGPAIPVLGDILRYTVAPLLSWLMLPMLLRKVFAPQPVPPRVRREFPVALALRPSQLRAAAEETALLIASAGRLAPGYADLAVPAAVIAADGDAIIEPEQARRLQQTLPRAVHRTIAGAGHMLHYADPAALVDAADLMANWPRAAT